MTDLATIDAADLDRAADPAAFVIQACERAKSWLSSALDHGDIDQIVELKSQAEAIRIYTTSKQLGKDAQLSATEIVRRAERGLGIVIRKGQQAGAIKRRGEHAGNQHAFGKAVNTSSSKPTPTDFASNDELCGNGAGIYQMTDNVSDDHFNAAIAEGKAEGNLSRANIVRKVRAKREVVEVLEAVEADPPRVVIPDPADRTGLASMQRRALVKEMAAGGYTSQQISDAIGRGPDVVRQMAREMSVTITADQAIGKGHRRIESNHIVRETASALEGLAMGAQLADVDDLDPSEIANWVASLTTSIRALNRLIKKMKEKTQ